MNGINPAHNKHFASRSAEFDGALWESGRALCQVNFCCPRNTLNSCHPSNAPNSQYPPNAPNSQYPPNAPNSQYPPNAPNSRYSSNTHLPLTWRCTQDSRRCSPARCASPWWQRAHGRRDARDTGAASAHSAGAMLQQQKLFLITAANWVLNVQLFLRWHSKLSDRYSPPTPAACKVLHPLTDMFCEELHFLSDQRELLCKCRQGLQGLRHSRCLAVAGHNSEVPKRRAHLPSTITASSAIESTCSDFVIIESKRRYV